MPVFTALHQLLFNVVLISGSAVSFGNNIYYFDILSDIILNIYG